jgi:hypothetical protein
MAGSKLVYIEVPIPKPPMLASTKRSCSYKTNANGCPPPTGEYIVSIHGNQNQHIHHTGHHKVINGWKNIIFLKFECHLAPL